MTGELSAIRESIQLTLEAEGPGGGPGTHELLDRAVEYYSLSYSRFPPAVLFEEVRRCRALLPPMLDHGGSDAARRHQRQMAGWLSALLGNLAFHLGDYVGARSHLTAAAELGSVTGDARLAAWGRGAQSMVARYQGRFDEAARRACEALDLAATPLQRSQLLAWVNLPVLALTGQREDAERALAQAAAELDADPRGAAPGRFGFDIAELELHAAEAYVMLGLPGPARAHAEASLAYCPRETPAWAAATATLCFADAAQHPVQAAERALDLMDRIPADRLRDTTRRRLKALADSLKAVDLPPVRTLHEWLRTLPPADRSRIVPMPRLNGRAETNGVHH